MLAPHSMVTFVGGVIVGGVMSRTVIVCTQLLLLPQASVAVHVRAMTLVPPQLVFTASLKVTVTALQPSEVVGVPVKLVPVFVEGHSKVTSAGRTIAGLIVSCTVMVCTQLETLPQASVAVHVR